MQYAKQKGIFSYFENLNLERKEVNYSHLDMIKTFITAIACGCSYIKDINYELKPYLGTANLLGMDSFPEQSNCNRFIRDFTFQNITEMDYIFNQIAKQLYSKEVIYDYDVDCTGLIANGKTYEFSEKGYFPNNRGAKGYQLMLGTSDDFILSMFFDPGNTSPGARFWDSYYNVCENFGQENIKFIRGDSIHGSGPNIQELMEINQPFLLRGYKSNTARNFSKNVPKNKWIEFDNCTKICDIGWKNISSCRYKVNIVLQKIYRPKKDKTIYRFLTSNIKGLTGPEKAWLYNDRVDIEILIEAEKNGLHITDFNTRSYTGNIIMMYLAFITHNVITSFRKEVLSKINLGDCGIKKITKKLMNIPAKIGKKGELKFPKLHPMIKRMFKN